MRFIQDGNILCVFPENTTVQGYKHRVGGGAGDISISFYQNGKLHYFYSDEDVLIGEILCKRNIFNNISLYENGNLKECTLALDKQITNIHFKKSTRILF